MTRRLWAALGALLLTGLYIFGVVIVMTYDPTQHYETLRKMVPAADLKRAEQDYLHLRTGNLAALQARMEPSLKNPESMKQLEAMQKMLPKEAPLTSAVISMNWNTNQTLGESAIRHTVLVLEFDYKDKTVLYTANYAETGGQVLITGQHINTEARALKAGHKMRFDALTTGHYMAMAAFVIIAAFTVWAFYVCLATPALKFKWAWAISIVVGVGILAFEWSSGRIVAVQPIHINFPPVTIMQMFYQSAMVNFTLPLGAIMFMTVGRKMIKVLERPDATVVANDEAAS